jgi:quaternary ammonium compound-resistance protein SugE
MPWLYLLIAGVLEIAWAVGLKYTDGFTRLWPSVFAALGMLASVFFLALAVQKIPIGTGYAIWTGVGAIGTAALGIVLFAESAAALRIVFIGLILVGVLGLLLTGR